MVCHLINKTFRQQSQLTQSVTEAACNNRPCMCCAIACKVKSLMICEIKGKQSADLSRYHVQCKTRVLLRSKSPLYT